MPRSWTKIVTVLKGCFNLSPRCQGDFHKNLGCFSSAVRLLSNDQASTPLRFSGRFCRTRKRNSRAWQPLSSELLWSVLLKSSSLFLPVPFLLPEDSARKALSWFGPWLVAKGKHEFTQKRKKKKSNCQEGRGSRLCSVSSWEAHPMSPHQGLGAATKHIHFLVRLPTDQPPVYSQDHSWPQGWQAEVKGQRVNELKKVANIFIPGGWLGDRKHR